MVGSLYVAVAVQSLRFNCWMFEGLAMASQIQILSTKQASVSIAEPAGGANAANLGIVSSAATSRSPKMASTWPAWMSRLPLEDTAPPLHSHAIAVAVPARDEAARIVACLNALRISAETAGLNNVCVIVLVNNSRDSTARYARAFNSKSMIVRVVEVTLVKAEAHAGGARRLALDLALAELPDRGVLMTTDADSQVDANWFAANLAEIEAGADAVAGVVMFAPDAHIPVTASRHAEWRLAQLQARLHWLLDPRPQDRWPTHIWAWGASLAVTASAYRAVGGLPAVPLAEDRAFAAMLDRHGFNVRRSHAPVVVTSHRRHGRAPGGLADMLAAYSNDVMPCDAALEPTASLVRRLAWRAHLRNRFAQNGPKICARMTSRLKIQLDSVSADEKKTFGNWWLAIENASPYLARERVLPASLPWEIRRAERLINRIERKGRPGDIAQSVDAIFP